MKSGIQKVVDNLPKLKRSFASLTKEDVYVGVPSTDPQRKPEPDEPKNPLNNATIAYIQDNGSPAANIPQRQFMIPGIQAARGRIINTFKAGAKSALHGNVNAANEALHRAGLQAQESIRSAINQGIPPPLAESTLKSRARRGSKGAKIELEERSKGLPASTTYAKPLVNTAQLRNAINYVIRPK